jgi:hypothetical protein
MEVIMRRVVFVWLFVVPTIVCPALPARAISQEGATVVARVQAEIDSITIDEGFRKGQVVGRESEARTHIAAIDRVLRSGSQQLRRLTADRAAPEVKAALQRLIDLEKYRNEIAIALNAAAKSGTATPARATPAPRAGAPASDPAKLRRFLGEHATGQNFSRCRLFLELAAAPDSTRLFPGTKIEDVTQALEILAKIDAACKGPYQGGLGSEFTADHETKLRKNGDLWCQAAAARQDLAKRAVRNLALSTVGIAEKVLQSCRADLEKHEGYLHIDETSVRRALYQREQFLADLGKRFEAHFKLVGITDLAELLAPLDKTISALFEEIDRLAPSWKFEAPAHDAASEAMAKRQVKAENPRATIRASGLKDAAWNIVKNRRGLPLERVRHGTVLYKVTGEKWCRQQAFTHTEAYAGGGGYTKASGVRLDYLRYLACK